MASPITSTPWFRQVQTLLTKNRRLLSRRPIHLFILLFSSVASVIFAWLAGRDARGKSFIIVLSILYLLRLLPDLYAFMWCTFSGTLTLILIESISFLFFFDMM